MSASAYALARCVGETRALTRTAQAMRDALEAGDTQELSSLVAVQEMGIWRLGQLMKGESVEGVDEPPDDLLEAARTGADDDLRQSLRLEMQSLADVSGQNAVLLKDGLMIVRGLLAILTGRFGEYGGGPGGPSGVFSRRA